MDLFFYCSGRAITLLDQASADSMLSECTPDEYGVIRCERRRLCRSTDNGGKVWPRTRLLPGALRLPGRFKLPFDSAPIEIIRELHAMFAMYR